MVPAYLSTYCQPNTHFYCKPPALKNQALCQLIVNLFLIFFVNHPLEKTVLLQRLESGVALYPEPCKVPFLARIALLSWSPALNKPYLERHIMPSGKA